MKIKSQDSINDTVDCKVVLSKLVSYIYSLEGNIVSTPKDKPNNLSKKEIAYVITAYHATEYYEN